MKFDAEFADHSKRVEDVAKGITCVLGESHASEDEGVDAICAVIVCLMMQRPSREEAMDVLADFSSRIVKLVDYVEDRGLSPWDCGTPH